MHSRVPVAEPSFPQLIPPPTTILALLQLPCKLSGLPRRPVPVMTLPPPSLIKWLTVLGTRKMTRRPKQLGSRRMTKVTNRRKETRVFLTSPPSPAATSHPSPPKLQPLRASRSTRMRLPPRPDGSATATADAKKTKPRLGLPDTRQTISSLSTTSRPKPSLHTCQSRRRPPSQPLDRPPRRSPRPNGLLIATKDWPKWVARADSP